MLEKYDWPIFSKTISPVSSYHQSIAFDSGGSRYLCVCGITSEDGDRIVIDNNNINRFEWVNEVNNLCISGFAEIVDSDGRIGEIFSKFFCHLVFEIKRFGDDSRRSDGSFENTSFSDSVFKHTFIINNFEIVRREKQFVVYRLYLVGIEWYGLTQNIIFSNYDQKIPSSSKSSEFTSNIAEFSSSSAIENKTPTEIFQIIKSILGTAFENKEIYDLSSKPGIDDKSFERFSSKIDLNVCFAHNTTTIDAITYLLNKLYYDVFSGENLIHDDLLKLLIYDEFANSYGVVGYGIDQENTPGAKDSLFIGTWESLFGTTFEALTNPKGQDLQSVIKKTNTDSLKTFFRKVYHYFTISGFQKAWSEPGAILEWIQSNPSIPKSKFQKYEPKLKSTQFKKFFPDGSKYEQHGSTWNNDFTIYSDQVTNLINKDVLVLHTKGDITHRPGMKFGIVSDAVALTNIDASVFDAKETRYSAKEIIGLFNVVKVRHIVKPNSTMQDNFTEKLFLSRNFVSETPIGNKN